MAIRETTARHIFSLFIFSAFLKRRRKQKMKKIRREVLLDDASQRHFIDCDLLSNQYCQIFTFY